MIPDLILINADIRTMDHARPAAQAMAIGAGKIITLGSTADIKALASPATKLIDAGGRLVLPGFQDAHIHLLSGGTDLVDTAYLYDATTLGELHAALKTHADRHAGPIVWGAGWQSGFFGDANLTRDVLDMVVSDRPCLIYDGNFHNACVNSVACGMIGITADTPDPLNGHIVRDATGHATGMLHEEAIAWALTFLPGTTDEVYARGLLAGQAHANRHGITGVLDPAIVDHHTRIYANAVTDGTLTLRVAGACLVTAADTVETALARLRALRNANGGPWYHLNAAKFFLDGGFENRTAALIAPYADAKGGNAPLMFAPEQIAALFTALDAERFQIHVHCIGDGATRVALDGFAAARHANGNWPSLHQIAHVQLVDPADMPRFAALGVMANMQPLWAYGDPLIPDDTMALIGPARTPQTYAFRSLLNAGAPYCINSDWPVTTLNPFEIIATAVTREPSYALGRTAPFLPQERLTVMECVQGYTTHAAAASWRGDLCGALRPGLSGDFVILNRDIFACDPYAIADTEVMLTVLEGRAVWQAPAFDTKD
jgi:predicted amidohydrolase YtcJ